MIGPRPQSQLPTDCAWEHPERIVRPVAAFRKPSSGKCAKGSWRETIEVKGQHHQFVKLSRFVLKGFLGKHQPFSLVQSSDPGGRIRTVGRPEGSVAKRRSQEPECGRERLMQSEE